MPARVIVDIRITEPMRVEEYERAAAASTPMIVVEGV